MAHNANTKRYNFHCKPALSDAIRSESIRLGKSYSWVLNRCVAEFFKDESVVAMGWASICDHESRGIDLSGNKEK